MNTALDNPLVLLALDAPEELKAALVVALPNLKIIDLTSHKDWPDDVLILMGGDHRSYMDWPLPERLCLDFEIKFSRECAQEAESFGPKAAFKPTSGKQFLLRNSGKNQSGLGYKNSSSAGRFIPRSRRSRFQSSTRTRTDSGN